jgi:hypothetical protein
LVVSAFCLWPALSARITSTNIGVAGEEHSQGVHSHATGLEEEHEHTEVARWPVTSNDKIILAKITQILNPPGADVPWEWKDESQSWTFGLVKLTAQDAKGALALHMLHRHGLGPLLASRAGTSFMDGFESKLQVQGNPTGVDKAKALVEAQEEYGAISELRELMLGLSLNGIRNLHSWDHAWSVRKGTGKVEGCTHSSPGGCVLQAGMSRSANLLLRQNGFSEDVCSSVKFSQFAIMAWIFNPFGYTKLRPSDRASLLTPAHTGDIEVKNWGTTGSSNPVYAIFKGSKKIVVDVHWEGGAVSELKIPIDADTLAALRATVSEREQLAWVTNMTETFISETVDSHKEYMAAERLTIWAGEQAEFVEMYDSLPEPVQ